MHWVSGLLINGVVGNVLRNCPGEFPGRKVLGMSEANVRIPSVPEWHRRKA